MDSDKKYFSKLSCYIKYIESLLKSQIFTKPVREPQGNNKKSQPQKQSVVVVLYYYYKIY